MTALAVALTCGPASEASALAHEAFSDGLDRFEMSAPIALGIAALILGEPSEGLEAIGEYSAYARRHGEVLSSIGSDLWGGFAHRGPGTWTRRWSCSTGRARVNGCGAPSSMP